MLIFVTQITLIFVNSIASILQMLSLSQVVGTPTHTGPSGDSSLIDLALISNTALLLYCSTIPPLANSDHNGLELSLKWRQSDRQVQQHPRTIWRYRNADFRTACQMIDETDWESLLPEELRHPPCGHQLAQ